MAFIPPYYLAYKSAVWGSGHCFVTTVNLEKKSIKVIEESPYLQWNN